jgi:hypothetical protein
MGHATQRRLGSHGSGRTGDDAEGNRAPACASPRPRFGTLSAVSNPLTILMWIGIVVGAIVGLFVVLSIIYIVWNIFTISTPEGVELEVSCPPFLGVDQSFSVGVTVRNLLERERTLRSLDFDNSLLKGFVVEKTEPKARESSCGLGTTAHYYDLRIPPRGHIHLALSCHAVLAGDYSGNVMVFVDTKHGNYLSKVARIVIR